VLDAAGDSAPTGAAEALIGRRDEPERGAQPAAAGVRERQDRGPDPDAVRAGLPFDGLDVRGVDLDDREVVGGVGPRHLTGRPPPVAERDRDLLAAQVVRVSEDLARRGHDAASAAKASSKADDGGSDALGHLADRAL
jgi:hypothetical protein